LSHLPLLSGQKLCTILRKAGYYFHHTTGNHIILRNINPPYRRLTVPAHKEIAKGTLRAILRQAGLTVDELKQLM